MKESAEVKYLGILIDKHLRWSTHIQYCFVSLRHILPISILRTVYLALVQSSIQYGIIAWGGTSKNALKPLILLQKRFIKICLKNL